MKNLLVLGASVLATGCFIAVDPAAPGGEADAASGQPADACAPRCSGRACGSDGCGGACGACAEGERCDPGGRCRDCVPCCAGRECGSDGCGGTCGACLEGQACTAFGGCAGGAADAGGFVPPDAGPVFGGENSDETCSDGVDNDGDGWLDCDDFGCCKAGAPAPGVTVCAPGSCVSVSATKTCAADGDCAAGEVCERCGAVGICAEGCRADDACAEGERCLRLECSTCPCPGRCAPEGLVATEVQTQAHQLGDGPEAEGTSAEMTFALCGGFTTASLELDFPGGPGPNAGSPPLLTLNGTRLPSVLPFFPAFDPADPRWQTNPDGSHDYNGHVHVSMDVSQHARAGLNTFRIENGRSDDDYVFANVWIGLE